MSSDDEPAAGLLSLPAELLLGIQSLLEPLDVAALQSTCTTLQGPSICRAVWLNTLRQVMDRNDVFTPTFPLDEMTISELRYAAIRPQVFLRRLKRCASEAVDAIGYLKYSALRAIDLYWPTHPEHVEEHIWSVILLPGGRYLLVVTHLNLYVHDLGQCTGSLKQEPIFVLPKADLQPVAQGIGWALDFHVVDGNDILLFFSAPLPFDIASHSPTSIIVYKIYDVPLAPKGEQIACLTLPDSNIVRLNSSYLPTRRVAFTIEPNIIGVWDYENNNIALWNCPDNWCLAGELCVMTPNRIILRNHKSGLLVYDIPPLLPVSSALAPRYRAPIRTLDDPGRNLRIHTLYHRSSGAFIFDFYLVNLLGGKLVRYRIAEIQDDSGSYMGPIRHACFPWLEDQFGDDNPLPLRALEGTTVATVYDGGHEDLSFDEDTVHSTIHIEDRDPHSEDEGEGNACLVKLLDRRDPVWANRKLGKVDFCPASGRLCELDGTRLLVFDYLPPPS
ncbi:hypothetical protein BD626DRAFT_226443 [Schizophyllum amplum]|uniref:F-box domain-containing protein n=1 Tax=Schizophyllum amplum TaxID=97359 RepID=A0A550BWQ9_9AGAR|nr:hypothetical protein BD626DRAFT_226443 [Auriculariopsis ampla]